VALKAGQPAGLTCQGRPSLTLNHPFKATLNIPGRLPLSDPSKIFNSHSLVRLGQTLFDPSYGTPSITGSNFHNELRMWEDQYVELWKMKVIDPANTDSFFKANAVLNNPEFTETFVQ
jgi:hypothetical protein